jgi:hypothetical protein
MRGAGGVGTPPDCGHPRRAVEASGARAAASVPTVCVGERGRVVAGIGRGAALSRTWKRASGRGRKYPFVLADNTRTC